ncbi:MAG: DUF1178 family protein, partial [Alphaproteobacteria bacterium]|nr:DUF1178 family protein [Alphaproteobacteria bacterium]
MILFELKCDHDHSFEAWFRNGETCEAQMAAGEVACPHCGSPQVAKAPMAPRLVKTRGHHVEEVALKMRAALTELRQHVEKTCDYVGDRFPEEARKIHYGESDPRPIYGEATPEESKALK